MIGRIRIWSDWDGVTRQYDPTLECERADPNCEGDVRSTPVGRLCGWHDAVRSRAWRAARGDADG